jgi:beta-barrel assembly-enhancing protease
MQRREFITRATRLLALGAAGGTLAGCASMDSLGSVGEQLGGVLDARQKEYLKDALRIGGEVAKATEQLDAEQEYYLGRTVTANVLARYPVFDSTEANDYVATLGRYVSLFSSQPETFGGYHFQIIDSDEINALSAPGGMITVTRGMLRCCRSEDELAAVLAHEIGHVQSRHGVQAIRQSRINQLATVVGSEVVARRGSDQLKELVGVLDGAIEDILDTLIMNGYSRSFESEADRAALRMLRRAGYDDRALIVMLEEMGRRLRPGQPDFSRTHPSPADRIRDIERRTGTDRPDRSPLRQRRFEQAMALV